MGRSQTIGAKEKTFIPLTHEQSHKLEQWRAPRAAKRNCPICASGQWETGEIVSDTSVEGSRNVLPMAQLVCQNCGYVMLLAGICP